MVDKPTKPTRLSAASLDLKDRIKEFTISNVTLLAEFPTAQEMIVEKQHVNSTEAYIKPNIIQKDSEPVSLADIRNSLASLKRWFNEVYNALRTVAPEILVFMLNDLDRYYEFEFNNSHPYSICTERPKYDGRCHAENDGFFD